jgi:hypothetical protein
MTRHSMMNCAVRSIKLNDLCMLELEFLAYDSSRDNQNSILFECHSDQCTISEDIRSATDSSSRQ